MSKKLSAAPKNVVIERTALELACAWYEIGRSQGMTSKWHDAKSYARANFTKFIPKAVELLIDMLGRSDIHALMKAEIFEGLSERFNDPELCAAMPNIPNIDITKLLPKHDRIADVNTILHNKINPYLTKGH